MSPNMAYATNCVRAIHLVLVGESGDGADRYHGVWSHCAARAIPVQTARLRSGHNNVYVARLCHQKASNAAPANTPWNFEMKHRNLHWVIEGEATDSDNFGCPAGERLDDDSFARVIGVDDPVMAGVEADVPGLGARPLVPGDE